MGTATGKILTVEDDTIILADLRLILEDAGYEVCAEAIDGLEAVALARRHRPDLILLDLGLPRLDGVEVTRWILEELDIPIVALTGRAPSLADNVLQAGAVVCLQKPFSAPQVVEAVAEALASRPHRRGASR
jgi:two-component system, response regulator PdtaR